MMNMGNIMNCAVKFIENLNLPGDLNEKTHYKFASYYNILIK